MSKKGFIIPEDQRKKMSESAKNRDCVIYDGMQVRLEHKFIDNVEHKQCSKCKEYQVLTEYWAESRRWDKLSSKCKTCSKKMAMIRYHNNVGVGGKDKKYVVNRRRDIKKQCIEYLGGKCSRCNLDHAFLKNTAVFQFHHKDPSQKDFSIAQMGNRKFENLIPELDKCLLLCSNCHHIIHWQIEEDELSKEITNNTA